MSIEYTDLQLDALRELANIGSGTASTALSVLLSNPVDTTDSGKWLAVLALYDAVFGLLAYALFDFLMED